jgi:23S rRNA (uridine2552-2'-O)-methyltransferase
MSMLEEVFAFAKEWLKPEGVLIAKVFRGGTETALLNELKLAFKKISHFKPESSRKESTEFYLIAQGFRL